MGEEKDGFLSNEELQKINDYLDHSTFNDIIKKSDSIETKKEVINSEDNFKEKFIQSVNRGISNGKEQNIVAQEKFIRETKEVENMVNNHSKTILNDALLKIGTGQAKREDYPDIPELQNIKEKTPTDSEKFISHVITGGNASNYDEAKEFMNTDFGDDEYKVRPR